MPSIKLSASSINLATSSVELILPLLILPPQLLGYHQLMKDAESLPDLTREEMLGLHYMTIGYAWIEKKEIDERHEYIDHLEKATECFNESIKLFPNNSTAYIMKGHIFLEKQNIDSALSNFKKAKKMGAKFKQLDYVIKTLENNTKRRSLFLNE